MLAKYNYRKSFNTYQIFLPDVDGLISGSPVRYMGIQVGYINQIDIVGADVYVKFIITDKNVKIPSSSVATVEFYGLGGSKSLEIYPPSVKKPESAKLIISQSPKRIHDSLGLLNQMYDNVVEITYTASHFMKEVGIIKKENDNGKKFQSAEQVLDFSNNWLDEVQVQQKKISKKINDKKGKKEKDGKGD